MKELNGKNIEVNTQIDDILKHNLKRKMTKLLDIFIIGGIYELDGVKYRLIKWRDSGVMTFQELNEDLTDNVKYYNNHEGQPVQVKDFGIRLISERLNEMIYVQ